MRKSNIAGSILPTVLLTVSFSAAAEAAQVQAGGAGPGTQQTGPDVKRAGKNSPQAGSSAKDRNPGSTVGPTNDACAGATSISGAGIWSFNSSGASTDGASDPLCDSFGDQQIYNDLWWAWTAEGSGDWTLDTCDQTGLDTKIAVYSGTNCPPGGPIVCNDDFCDFQSSVTFEATNGNTYLVRIGSFSPNDTGSGTFTVGPVEDCNQNGVPDAEDIAAGTSEDCNNDGVPDSCQIVGNDCNQNGVPDECDIDSGNSNDNNGDGVPDDCDCNPVDRCTPGSLLVFPEMDNRDGVYTVFTVTDMDCQGGDDIVVHYVYVDGDSCQEENEDHTLTPCDTLTHIADLRTSFEQGYIYAYARNDTDGQPISHNKLIGDLLILDAFAARQYKVKPFTFRSPLPPGTETDLNDNEKLDLDTFEYDGPPDQVLVPRFFGVVPGTRDADLVVLNLSGTGQHLVTLGIDIYDDSENSVFRQMIFECWDKRPLLAISDSFSNAALAATSTSPGEILGMTGQKAGWMRIDGVLSIGPQLDEITDPAFLAVLVEYFDTNAESAASAAIPFEMCTQINGDFLSSFVVDPLTDP